MSIVDELYNKIDDGREGKNIGLKTGLPKLDFYTGGFKKGVYSLYFSKSSVGKIINYIKYNRYKIYKNNNFAVLKSDFKNNDRAISEKAKLYIKTNYPEYPIS